jgi:hypothetical protein
MDTIIEENAALAGRGAPNLDRQQQNIIDDHEPINADLSEVKIQFLLEDIGASIGPIECQLNVLAAMVVAGDSTGAVYALRRLKAQWRCLDIDARCLIAADAERLSAIRRGEAS